MQPLTSIVLALSALTCVARAQYGYDSEVVNKCPQPTDDQPVPDPFYYTHPDDCKKFIICSFGFPYVLPCPAGTVFSEVVIGCVDEKSRYNNNLCTSKQQRDSLLCRPGSTELVPHPDFCQRYYNCSDTSGRRYSFLKPYENECKYPDLFDYVSKTCKNFEQATCLPGTEIGVEPCEYLKNRCFVAHCQPCKFTRPSCLGRSDGYHENPRKLWSPFYVKCYKNRSIEFPYCGSQPANTNNFMVFSPVKKTCVTVWEVPRENGGLKPDCLGREERRLYATEESNRTYFSCPAAEVSFCDDGEVFSEGRQSCGKP